MFFIVWGSRVRDVTVKQTPFYCPHCHRQRTGNHRRVRRYFTLYWIPLFPIETLVECVQCNTCTGQFEMGVLQLTPEQIEEATAPWKCDDCGNANPAEHEVCVSCQSARGATRRI